MAGERSRAWKHGSYRGLTVTDESSRVEVESSDEESIS